MTSIINEITTLKNKKAEFGQFYTKIMSIFFKILKSRHLLEY